jgi:hypothetical protein
MNELAHTRLKIISLPMLDVVCSVGSSWTQSVAIVPVVESNHRGVFDAIFLLR